MIQRPATGFAIAALVAGAWAFCAGAASADPPSAEETLLGGNVFEASGETLSGPRNLSTFAQQGDTNTIHLSQSLEAGATAGNVAALVQAGDGNLIELEQTGSGNSAHLTQAGDANAARSSQLGDNNLLALTQVGTGLAMTVTQYGGATMSVVQTGY